MYALCLLLDASVSQFVKLLSATPTQVLSLIIEPEKVALEAQLAGLEQGEESEECFIQAALEDLKVLMVRECIGGGHYVVFLCVCLPFFLYRLEKMSLPKQNLFELKWTEQLRVRNEL